MPDPFVAFKDPYSREEQANFSKWYVELLGCMVPIRVLLTHIFQVTLCALVGFNSPVFLALVMLFFPQDRSMLLLEGSPLSPPSVFTRFSTRR